MPHQQKISDLEAEARSFQQMFFNVRRELERSKTEFAAYTEHQEAARASDRATHDAGTAGCVGELSSWRLPSLPMALMAAVAAQFWRPKYSRWKLRMSKLMKENDDLQEEHDGAIGDTKMPLVRGEPGGVGQKGSDRATQN